MSGNIPAPTINNPLLFINLRLLFVLPFMLAPHKQI
jgi:hypothetical protein